MKDFTSFIKNYSTRDLIYFFSELSIDIYNNQRSQLDGELPCTIKFPLNILQHGFIPKQEQVMLSAWDIQDIAYLSIVNANDYRREIITKEKAGVVVNLYRGYVNEHSKNKYIPNVKLPNVFKYMMGMTYEQFKYQNLAWTYQSFCRNYHILQGSSRINRNEIIDINEITKELFGVCVDDFLVNIIYLVWLCTRHPDPLGEKNNLSVKNGNHILNKENLQKILAYYSVTYEEVRESPIQKQLFYSKPFVVTQKKEETIMVSLYLVQMLFADGLYWLIRDYYYKNGMGNRFINAFGTMFEEYFIELAELYLTKDMWYKIRENGNKSADFFVEFEEAVFLFELKSGILGINAKQQVPDVQQIDIFYKRNIWEAYGQLKMSEKEYQGQKPVVKVFLLYESMSNTQILMSSMPKIFVEDKGYYIMTIEDLERMLVTYKNDKEKFQYIVSTLVANQNSNTEITSVLHVLNEYDAIGDMHFINERDYFMRIAKKWNMN